MMAFSCFIAVFHTLILNGLFRLKFNGWLFFIMNPQLICFGYLIYAQASIFIFIIQFLSVFILGFIGILYSVFEDSKEENLELDQLNLKFNNGKPKTWTSYLKGFGSIVLLFIFPLIIIIWLIKLILARINPNSRSRFLKLNKSLSNFELNSKTKGTSKIVGKIKMIEPLIAPIENKECVAYYYLIEKIYSDSEGEQISNFFTDKKCNSFFIETEIGQILIKPENLDFLWLDLNKQYKKNQKRYNQYLLKEGDLVTIIGSVNFENKKPVLEFDKTNKIFIIAPTYSIENYFKNRSFLDKWFDNIDY